MSARKGFTIIELMLAMSFVAVLLITVAFLVIRITAIYQKGLSIRSVNQVGRNLIIEFSRAVADSPVDDSLRTRDRYFYSIPATGTQRQGAFCTGRYSFVWNSGRAINDNDRINFRNAVSPNVDFRLLRLEDTTRVVCDRLKAMDLAHGSELDFRTITGHACGTPGAQNHVYHALQCKRPVEMLQLSSADAAADTTGASESDLAIYDFRVFPPTINRLTGHAFYSATFILATLRGVDINTSGNYCVNISETLNTDFAYCAINKFNFAMSTAGQGGLEDDYGQRDLTDD